ncbi:MAG: prephenate dehydrogenase/arogenate dehydrogenase family protein [Pseudomonadota bacterium]
MTTPLFNTLSLIGLGLIGSSIARKAKQQGLAGQVIGYDQDDETRIIARDLKLVDHVTDRLSQASKADLVILCTPLSSYFSVVATLAPELKPGTILSDVGSVKNQLGIEDLLPEGIVFIPAHPLAGTEHSGPHAGFAELFENRWCLITAQESPQRDQVAAFWRRLGSTVAFESSSHHDRVMAITSHLPHLIAFAIVGTADQLEDDVREEIIRYAASGFRSFTRIAGSDPTMWRDVFLRNKAPLLEIIDRFIQDLTRLHTAIDEQDGDFLYDLILRTRKIRRDVIRDDPTGTPYDGI